MNGDAGLVGCLVERLTTRLPHRTGTQGPDFHQDEIIVITRASLLKISASSIEVVLDPLITLLEELVRPYRGLGAQPAHVFASAFYVFELIADCCAASWQHQREKAANGAGENGRSVTAPVLPGTMDGILVRRIMELCKVLLDPVPDGWILPSITLLEDYTMQDALDRSNLEELGLCSASDSPGQNILKVERGVQLEPHVKTIIEYCTAGSWHACFEYLRSTVFGIRTAATMQSGIPQPTTLAEEEKGSLTILRLLAYTWVDAQKLGSVVQELCSSFLHFKKSFQNTVAIALPMLIRRWIDRYPGEFVRLHSQHRRLDCGADTLFDMAQAAVDNTQRRAILSPMQMSLLFLLPDVFEVASGLREAKSGGMNKKMHFLDGLRKGLKNRNESAAYCVLQLLRVVRRFDIDSDAAIISYAMDIQDEVRDATFRRTWSGETTLFDQDMITAAFTFLTHLNLEGSVESLAQTCLHPSSPMIFKIAIIQACAFFAREQNADKYNSLFVETVGFVQSQMKTMFAVQSNMASGNHATQRKASEANAANLTLLRNILKFLEPSPEALLENPPEDNAEAFYEDIFQGLVSCMVSPDDQVRILAGSVAKNLFSQGSVLARSRKGKRLDQQSLRSDFWSMTSAVLNNICDSHPQQGDEATLRSIHSYLESRLILLKSIQELTDPPREIPERTATSTKLETLFLVSLCSPDIETCQLVTSCIALFQEECALIDAIDSTKTGSVLLRNSDIFEELGSRAFRFTGVVAFQKRIRNLLRRMQFPSAGILNAWEVAFDKWLHLSKDVSTTAVDSVDDRTLSEWRNYTGFLASLGGICTADQAFVLEEPAISGLKWIDRLSSENFEEPLLSRYLRLSVQLLACTNVRVRETMRDVLSTEISPNLYQPLFKALESELEVLFTGALETAGKNSDGEIIFAEQASSLLKALVERLHSPSDLGAASSVHLGALALNFAKFLEGAVDNMNCLRVKIKVCQLCEVLTKKKEHLNLRDDVRIRNQLLEFIFGWIARPRSPRGDGTYGPGRQDEVIRVQKDLDKACLRSLAELTFRLPLQPGEGHNDAGTSELKSQMFHTYFNRFLSLLNYESQEGYRSDHLVPPTTRDDTTSAADLAITILSNLLSANIDVGLKHSLSIGYHDNIEIRTAFLKVLFNILVQGTEFSNLSDAAVNEKYDELLSLLTHDTQLAVAIATVCPSNEVDELTISLLNIFESRGMAFDLMEGLIRQEIEETENESEILRRNCVATKVLSIYAKWKGAQYLRDTLQKVVERLMLTSQDLDLELDPARGIQTPEDIQKNALQLRVVTKVFIDDIRNSATNIPASFRKICSIISEAVLERFPEAKYTAVGAFIFLRFFCPAIVAPEVEGLVDTPPSKEMRRGLLLIAKVVQNLANNVLFGAKEPYMFPLNEFLTENIYDVTTFLRQISVTPDSSEIRAPDPETFDFGSCVALHRFLYDHWDQVRQKLMSRERRDYVRSPAELPRGRSPVLEPLRSLITNLGPPPLAVTWNRPQISANSPPAYSRFQQFMLRNAFRGTESFMTSRAVYDGGESKDGLSIICIILRHIDSDSIDYDTLLYCYLKIASRLWHRPFGILIDATCYNGQNEPPDDFFKKLDLLCPMELSRQLSRVYVYNMNSAFRKCLRRVLRVATKSDTSVFNPGNVDYHLIGSLQDLQAHFHLSQLHLPKETISVVTDTRFVFQPITRLSKTRGKIEVIIKVGSQFVQVTTVRKQEVHPGFRLNATVNDIFRLGEVEEAPTSIPTEDDSAFGLRADNGKIVMYFQSPKKADVLQAVRGAKVKYGKDTRTQKSFERLIRPQDVPGTLLNLALTNLAAPDSILRLASYNLLGALCRAFKFKAASKFMLIRDISVPLDPTQFIVNISKHLAQEEPQLTADFLNEFFGGWESISDEQKPLSLAYMAPWLPGLRTTLLGDETDSEKGKEKIATIFRKLIDVAITDPTLNLTLELTVWPAIYKDETLLDIFLEEVLKAALSLGLYDEHTLSLTTIVTAMGTITLRGKIISRLRKALNRSSQRPTKILPDNAVWPEICILLQFCLSLSFDCGVQSQLYLPEIFHIVTMLANTGTSDIRVLVHRLLINTIHAACTSFKLDDAKLARLRSSLETLSEPRNDIFSPPPAFVRDGASISTTQESGQSPASTEHLASLLFEVCSVAAPSVDMANAWRSRWMSLVASTAFQNNPAIQPRAFMVMGCLAREEVDDDLLYQVLVALRNAVGRFGEDNHNEMMVAIVTSLSKMMGKLMTASRYGLQLFWLAISLLRLVPPNLFNCAANFLEAVLTNIGTAGDLRNDKMAQVLLQGRGQLEDAAVPLDVAYGIHFTAENFHFAVCACLTRGLTDTMTKATALRVLSTFLEMTTTSSSFDADRLPRDVVTSPYLALIQARAVEPDELKDALYLSGLHPSSVASLGRVRSLRDFPWMKDKDLLLNTAIELVDFQYLGDAVQNRTLLWLNELAMARPSVILHLCSPVAQMLDDILLHCQNSSTLESAHALFQTMTSNPKFPTTLESSGELNEILEELGFGGLWRSCSFSQTQEPDKQCFALTEKLIELIII
ncbi:putative GTPase-activator protein for ras-like GTPase [Seiridium cardinale]|uniref:GTPase-activator protein for ras-like GTPase n=1 Tax=Seiridium cardinale TaxID=138064 RepID=A0ABR2XZX2_9PEZI